MASKPELKPDNFSSALKTAYGEGALRYKIPDDVIRRISGDMRKIIGNHAWDSSKIIGPADLANLYGYYEKLAERMGNENNKPQQLIAEGLGRAIATLASTYGVEVDRMQSLIDHKKIEGLFGHEVGIKTASYDNAALLSVPAKPPKPEAVRDAPKPRQKPGPKPRPVKKERALTADDQSPSFTDFWKALQTYANDKQMDADGITSFIARGTQEAINLDQESFTSKCSLARKSLSWNQADSPEAQKLIDGLEAAYQKHHEKRALGGIKRD